MGILYLEKGGFGKVSGGNCRAGYNLGMGEREPWGSWQEDPNPVVRVSRLKDELFAGYRKAGLGQTVFADKDMNVVMVRSGMVELIEELRRSEKALELLFVPGREGEVRVEMSRVERPVSVYDREEFGGSIQMMAAFRSRGYGLAMVKKNELTNVLRSTSVVEAMRRDGAKVVVSWQGEEGFRIEIIKYRDALDYWRLATDFKLVNTDEVSRVGGGDSFLTPEDNTSTLILLGRLYSDLKPGIQGEIRRSGYAPDQLNKPYSATP